MEFIITVIAVFLVGALVGFGLATIVSSNQFLTVYDENERLKQGLADATGLSPEHALKVLKEHWHVIEIKDHTEQKDYFTKF